MKRKKYYADKKDPLVWLSCGLMAASFCARLWWALTEPGLGGGALLLHAVLPLSCCLLYGLLLPLCGRRALWTTAVPALLGCVFFALKAQGFSPLHRGLCLLLYLAVAALYTLTVTGLLPTRRLLIPLFGLPLVYHLLVEDRNILRTAQPPLTLHQWLPEISVLLIMAALLCAALAIREEDKPKINKI